MRKVILTLGAIFASSILNAAAIYDNLNLASFQGSSGNYTNGSPANNLTHIGDDIFLFGSSFIAGNATTEFSNNNASSGTFNATLRFYNATPGVNPPNPVGTQIGGDFTINNIAIGGAADPCAGVGCVDGSNGYRYVTFQTNYLDLGVSRVIWTISVSGLTGITLTDLGISQYDPVLVGSSDVNYGIVSRNGGTTFERFDWIDNGIPPAHYGNLAFQVNGVPEPATYALFGAGLAAIGLLGRRKK